MSDVSATAHRHQWRIRSRIDGCHFIEIRRYCPDCGAQGAEFEERDFSDPFSITFALHDCPRCVELAEASGHQEPWSWHLNP